MQSSKFRRKNEFAPSTTRLTRRRLVQPLAAMYETDCARDDRLRMLGDHGNTLVVDSHRSLQTRTLLAYNASTIRLILRESYALSDDLARRTAAYGSQANPDEGSAAELTISALALYRNKRSLLVYHQQRMEVIRDKLWETGGLMGAAFPVGSDGRAHMAPLDEVFAKAYESVLFEYRNALLPAEDPPHEVSIRAPYGPKVDQNGNLVMKKRYRLIDATDILSGGTEGLEPPTEIFVNVRVMKEVGEVETKKGKLSLTKGSQYYLVREEVENLLVQGFLEVIE